MTSTGITVESLVRRDRVILLSSVGLLAAIAWLAMVRGHAHTAERVGEDVEP